LPAESEHCIASLPAAARVWLPRLGVFEQGAQETLLLAITGLGQVGPKPDLATGVTRDTWPALREALGEAGLLREEPVPGGGRPYLRFDPLLSAAAASGLTPNQRDILDRRHQHHYFQLAGQLLRQWRHDPVAALALAAKERPNLVKALEGALVGGEEWAAEFLERLTPLFEALGLHAELGRWNEALVAYAPFIEQIAAAAADPGRRAGIEPLLAAGEAEGWTAGIAAVRRILAGERDEDGLCAGLDLDDRQVIGAILRAVHRSGEGTD
jgi:hypothetical protein